MRPVRFLPPRIWRVRIRMEVKGKKKGVSLFGVLDLGRRWGSVDR